jgi:excisionase family DNA binding protein
LFNITDSRGDKLPSKKRTEITIETDRTVVISRRSVQLRAWCEACERKVLMITVDEAASLARVTSRTVYRWVEGGKLHFVETPEGRLQVCSESTLRAGLPVT